MLRNSVLLCFFWMLSSTVLFAQHQSALSVEKIMQDPKWMGTSPDMVHWDLSGQHVYFNWNPEQDDLASLYRVNVRGNSDPEKVDLETRRGIIRQYTLDAKRQRALFIRDGDIFLKDLKSGNERRLTNTLIQESNARFGPDEKSIVFQQGMNFFALHLERMELEQLSNFSQGGSSGSSGAAFGGMRGGAGASSAARGQETEQNRWLNEDQLALFEVLKENERMDSVRRAQRESERMEPRMKTINITDGRLTSQQISPDLRYIAYRVISTPTGNKNTIVPNYVTTSGYTEDLNTRTKVGNALPVSRSYVYDRLRDTIIRIKTHDIPGIKDLPDFWDDYPDQKAELIEKNADRNVTVSGPYWNETGSEAFVVVTASDNKDRWIMRLDAENGTLHLIDRQRDEAWIAGPGIGGSWGGGNVGWIDQNTLYFQSEASGYSHLYTANIHTGAKNQLTSGQWEVQSLQLSNDKKHFYLRGNKEHPGITHFYKLPVNGGELVQLTSMKGGNEVSLSPDEKWLAIRYSYSNKPWELYIQENKPGAEARQITHSSTKEFLAYDWKEPDVISFKNRHGDDVYARVYQPETPKAGNPAVIFVHGAGYLQNVHYWWSQYFREYMFHNLLVDLGYTVLDIDFTASSGYGRDHRTGIYRHMGGKDLSDQVDGAQLLVEKYGVNPKNIGLYGGSYGGFITLMALFNEPDVFAAGAALRSVTDWAHYNHGYTSNILNEPFTDPLAYKRSSPIYFAEGLKGHLLMAHGMVDVNVHFQDIVRLSQRLIELGKDNWELAVYPLEDHGFVTPSSWTDEYKRILKLFEERLTN